MSNGEKYEGEWKDDMAVGNGICIKKLNLLIGIYSWPDGTIYEGNFKEGRKEN